MNSAADKRQQTPSSQISRGTGVFLPSGLLLPARTDSDREEHSGNAAASSSPAAAVHNANSVDIAAQQNLPAPDTPVAQQAGAKPVGRCWSGSNALPGSPSQHRALTPPIRPSSAWVAASQLENQREAARSSSSLGQQRPSAFSAGQQALPRVTAARISPWTAAGAAPAPTRFNSVPEPSAAAAAAMLGRNSGSWSTLELQQFSSADLGEVCGRPSFAADEYETRASVPDIGNVAAWRRQQQQQQQLYAAQCAVANGSSALPQQQLWAAELSAPAAAPAAAAAATVQENNEMLAASLLALQQQNAAVRQLVSSSGLYTSTAAAVAGGGGGGGGATVLQQLQHELLLQQQQQQQQQQQRQQQQQQPRHSSAPVPEVAANIAGCSSAALEFLRVASWPLEGQLQAVAGNPASNQGLMLQLQQLQQMQQQELQQQQQQLQQQQQQQQLQQQLQLLQQHQAQMSSPATVQQALGVIDQEINRLLQLRLGGATAGANAAGSAAAAAAAAASVAAAKAAGNDARQGYEDAWRQQMIAARAAAVQVASMPAVSMPGECSSNRSSLDILSPYAVQQSTRSSMDLVSPYAMPSSTRSSMDTTCTPSAMQRNSRASLDMLAAPFESQRGSRNSIDMVLACDAQRGSRSSFDMQRRGSVDMVSPYAAARFAAADTLGALDARWTSLQGNTAGSAAGAAAATAAAAGSAAGNNGRLATPTQQQLQQHLLQQRQLQRQQGLALAATGASAGGAGQAGISWEEYHSRLLELRDAQGMQKVVEDELLHFLPM